MGVTSLTAAANSSDDTIQVVNTRGFPNDRLLEDIGIFIMRLNNYVDKFKLEDKMLERRFEQLSLARKDGFKEWNSEVARNYTFLKNCEYFDLPIFDTNLVRGWEHGFLTTIKRQIIEAKPLSEKQVQKLFEILTPAEIERHRRHITGE